MLTKEQLIKAIEGERGAITFYEHVKTLTGDEEHLKAFGHIIHDEKKHLKNFEELYQKKFGSGMAPHPSSDVSGPGDGRPHLFTDALRQAINDELEAYEFYRDVYMDCTSEQVKVPFYEAMTDENEHAARLNMMYTREVEKRTM
jgi:rubrerythrin